MSANVDEKRKGVNLHRLKWSENGSVEVVSRTLPAVGDLLLECTPVIHEKRTFEIQIFECWMTTEECFFSQKGAKKPIVLAAVFEKGVRLFDMTYSQGEIGAVIPRQNTYLFDFYRAGFREVLETLVQPVSETIALKKLEHFACQKLQKLIAADIMTANTMSLHS